MGQLLFDSGRVGNPHPEVLEKALKVMLPRLIEKFSRRYGEEEEENVPLADDEELKKMPMVDEGVGCGNENKI